MPAEGILSDGDYVARKRITLDLRMRPFDVRK